MIIAGPLWGNFISRYVELNIPDDITEPHLGEGKMPSFGFQSVVDLVAAGAGGTENHRRTFCAGRFYGLPVV